MPRLSINEVTTFRWTFEEDLAAYQAAGIKAMGIWRQKLSDCGEEKAIELIAETGMAVSNLQWAGGFTGSDGRTFRESVEDAEEAIRLAAALHAGVLVVYTGARRGHTHNHARRLLLTALSELAPLAEALDIDLALEPMHVGCATDWTFLTDVDEAVRMIEKVDSPRLGLVFDTYHLGRDETAVEQIPQLAHRVKIVHLGDGSRYPVHEQNRCPLGEGVVPLQTICQELYNAGYDGDYDVELMGEDVEHHAYEALLSQSQQFFATLFPAHV